MSEYVCGWNCADNAAGVCIVHPILLPLSSASLNLLIVQDRRSFNRLCLASCLSVHSGWDPS